MTTKVDFDRNCKQFDLFQLIKAPLIDECEKEKAVEYDENIDVYCVSNQITREVQKSQSSDEFQDYNHRTTEIIQNMDKQSEFYKRIGFQSTQPMNDFRASGLLGVMSFIYSCNICSNFILNASYSQQLPYSLNEQLLKQELQNGEYYYPIAVSMIQITFDFVNILQQNEQFQYLLINNFVYECLIILQNSVEFGKEIDRLYSNYQIELINNELDVDLQSHKYDTIIYPYINKLIQINEDSDPYTIFKRLQQFSQQLTDEKANVVCLTPVFINQQIISGIHPCCYQQLFLAIAYLTIELNRRLSIFTNTAQYIQYQEQYCRDQNKYCIFMILSKELEKIVNELSFQFCLILVIENIPKQMWLQELKTIINQYVQYKNFCALQQIDYIDKQQKEQQVDKNQKYQRKLYKTAYFEPQNIRQAQQFVDNYNGKQYFLLNKFKTTNFDKFKNEIILCHIENISYEDAYDICNEIKQNKEQYIQQKLKQANIIYEKFMKHPNKVDENVEQKQFISQQRGKCTFFDKL